jgi:CBS domain-containing protein
MITILSVIQIACCVLALVLLRRQSLSRTPVGHGGACNVAERQDALFAKRAKILQVLADITSGDYGAGLKVGDLMSSHLSTVSQAEPADVVRRHMAKMGLRHLLVVDRSEHLMGVISDRDLNKPGKTAVDLMTPNPMTVGPETPLSPAITTLITKHISSLPVVQSGKLIGVLTRSDLMLSLQCILQALQKASAAGAAPASKADKAKHAVPA